MFSYLKSKSWFRTNSRKRSPSLAAIVVLAIIGVTTVVVGFASQQQAPTPTPSAAGSMMTMDDGSKQPMGRVLPYSRPVSLTIPAIDVKSQLIQVGQTSGGAIEVPAKPHFDNAAWYKYSPSPGQYGASVIIGHVDNRYTGASVFFNLGKLKPQDTIQVKRADGLTAVFNVTAVRAYTKADFPTGTVYTGHNDAELHLITCGGTFNETTRHYDKNIIVFATLTDSHK